MDRRFDLGVGLRRALTPVSVDDWATVIGVVIFGVMVGLAVVAMLAARQGIAPAVRS